VTLILNSPPSTKFLTRPRKGYNLLGTLNKSQVHRNSVQRAKAKCHVVSTHSITWAWQVTQPPRLNPRFLIPSPNPAPDANGGFPFRFRLSASPSAAAAAGALGFAATTDSSMLLSCRSLASWVRRLVVCMGCVSQPLSPPSRDPLYLRSKLIGFSTIY
jgi:hypothetical protein